MDPNELARIELGARAADALARPGDPNDDPDEQGDLPEAA